MCFKKVLGKHYRDIELFLLPKQEKYSHRPQEVPFPTKNWNGTRWNQAWDISPKGGRFVGLKWHRGSGFGASRRFIELGQLDFIRWFIAMTLMKTHARAPTKGTKNMVLRNFPNEIDQWCFHISTNFHVKFLMVLLEHQDRTPGEDLASKVSADCCKQRLLRNVHGPRHP